MKKINLIVGIILVTCVNQSFSQGIKFVDISWNNTLALARETNKPIFVDVYTTTCAPCIKMNKEIFPDQELGKFFNDSLICFKMDANSGEGKPVCAKYRVNAFPTFLYFSPEGELCYKTIGFKDVQGLFKDATQGLMETREEKPLAIWEREFETRKMDPGFIYNYIVKRQHCGLPIGKLMDEYLSLLPKEQRYNRKNIDLIKDNAETLPAPGITYDVVLTCRDTLLTRYSIIETNEILDHLFMQYSMGILESAIESREESKLDMAISIASNIRSPELRSAGYELQIRKTYFGETGDYGKMADLTEQFIDTYILPDNGRSLIRDTLSTIMSLDKACSVFFYYVDEESRLNKALRWSERSMELSGTSEMYRSAFFDNSLNMKANLLYKTGDAEKAIKIKTDILKSIPAGKAGKVQKIKEEIAAMKKKEKIWDE